MVAVAVGYHTEADLLKMKFLILALCVCAASAASFGYTPYQTNRQKTFVVTPVATAPVVAAKATYGAAKFPVAAAKATYETAKYPVATPVAAAKATYETAKYAVATPVAAAKATYEAAKYPAAVPVAAAKATYEATKYPAAVPVAAAKATYEATKYPVGAPVAAAKTVYNNGKESEAAILRANSEVTNEGFNYNFETGNGIAAQSSGVLRKVDNAEVVVSQGSYQYTAPDGTPVLVSYVADENGYQPRSDLLPVGPPVPEAIARAVEYILTHPKKTTDVEY